MVQKDTEDALRKIKTFFAEYMAQMMEPDNILKNQELSEAEKKRMLNMIRKDSKKLSMEVAGEINNMLDAVYNKDLRKALES